MASSNNAADATIAGQSTGSSNKVEFFTLPRELRDHVYDSILTGSGLLIPQPDARIRVKVCNAPTLQTLLISRHFHAEHVERSRKCTYLELRDSGLPDPFHLLRKDDVIPPNLMATHCNIHLACHLDTPYDYTDDEADCFHRAQPLVRIACNQSLPFELSLYVKPEAKLDSYIHFISEDLGHRLEMKERALLRSVKLWRCRWGEWPCFHKYERFDRADIVANYSHHTGRLLHADGTETQVRRMCEAEQDAGSDRDVVGSV